MTKEQAIKLLSKDTSIDEIHRLKDKGLSHTEVTDKIQEAIDMGIEAIEKQIRKKPKGITVLGEPFFEDEVIIKYGDCDICGFNVHSDICDYCPNCGQKIDWSEVDDN